VLEDGDFVECFWHKTHKQTPTPSLVVFFHGLAGDYSSPYIQGNVKALSEAGFDTVVMHFRGCGTKPNTLPISYHSGKTDDPLAFVTHLRENTHYTKIYGVGFSLGANMLLKLLGESRKNSPFDKAVAISAPMQLDICADAINKGISRYYQYRLLKELKNSLDEKYEHFDMEKLLNYKRSDIAKIKTFWEFDEVYTAPIHGYASAQEYYTKCSSKQFLKDITTPTLIIHSKDDPFMTPEVIPNTKQISSSITLNITKKGGHVGFVEGSFFTPKYYLEEEIIGFFQA